ncbi:hypothetical protein GGF46_003431 [Coemansia sp. RSA 552]|nr:hypothetical protein GGF46_003431 [Coemansia sp. RSA 552]
MKFYDFFDHQLIGDWHDEQGNAGDSKEGFMAIYKELADTVSDISNNPFLKHNGQLYNANSGLDVLELHSKAPGFKDVECAPTTTITTRNSISIDPDEEGQVCEITHETTLEDLVAIICDALHSPSSNAVKIKIGLSFKYADNTNTGLLEVTDMPGEFTALQTREDGHLASGSSLPLKIGMVQFLRARDIEALCYEPNTCLNGIKDGMYLCPRT